MGDVILDVDKEYVEVSPTAADAAGVWVEVYNNHDEMCRILLFRPEQARALAKAVLAALATSEARVAAERGA